MCPGHLQIQAAALYRVPEGFPHQHIFQKPSHLSPEWTLRDFQEQLQGHLPSLRVPVHEALNTPQSPASRAGLAHHKRSAQLVDRPPASNSQAVLLMSGSRTFTSQHMGRQQWSPQWAEPCDAAQAVRTASPPSCEIPPLPPLFGIMASGGSAVLCHSVQKGPARLLWAAG